MFFGGFLKSLILASFWMSGVVQAGFRSRFNPLIYLSSLRIFRCQCCVKQRENPDYTRPVLLRKNSHLQKGNSIGSSWWMLSIMLLIRAKRYQNCGEFLSREERSSSRNLISEGLR